MTIWERVKLWYWRGSCCGYCDTCPTSEPNETWCEREGVKVSVEKDEYCGPYLHVRFMCRRASYLFDNDPGPQGKHFRLFVGHKMRDAPDGPLPVQFSQEWRRWPS